MDTRDSLLLEIDRFCEAHDLTPAKFGVLAVNDWRFVNDLRGINRTKPRRVWPETAEFVRTFMAAFEAGAQNVSRGEGRRLAESPKARRAA